MKNILKSLNHNAQLLIILLLSSSIVSFPTNTKLYTSSDPLLILTSSTFSSNIYRKSYTVFVIQFYNSWCGHCISFAPTFKSLAADVQKWDPFVKLGVIDCADDINTKICRDMDISLYPTLRGFWFNAPPDDKGTELKGYDDKNADNIRQSIISFVMDMWSQGVPRLWPDLHPISAITKDQFIRMLPIGKGIPIIIVIEDHKSFIGREVILDLAKHQTSVTVLRMINSSELLLNSVLPKPLKTYALPILVSFNTDYTFTVLQNPSKVSDKRMLRQKYVNYIKNMYVKPIDNSMNKKNEKSQKEGHKSIDTTGFSQSISMVDLNNALKFSLFHEIALKKKLNSTQILALRNYLTVLELYFPFQNDKTSVSVKHINEWLSKNPHGIDTDIMSEMMKNYDMHFPVMKKWKSCAGSEPKYRGYPCAVWTLFHVLTVNEYLKSFESPKWQNLHAVLYAMRGYVTNFFGCSSCADHFKQMTNDLESVLKYPNSSVLWLWDAHNKVNERLRKDLSEDPIHPKIPFPPITVCPQCYSVIAQSSDQQIWVMPSVLQYLVNTYQSDNIVNDETDVLPYDDQKNIVINNGLKSGDKPYWSYVLFNGTDYSLILFLYFACTGLVISLCVFLRLRRRRKIQRPLSKSSLFSP